MQTVIKTYIRDKSGNPRGVCVAVRENDEVFYGFSLCNPGDKYDKAQGMKIALARAAAPRYQLPKLPARREEVLKGFQNLEGRALKYFKDLKYSQVALFPELQ